MVTRTNLLMRNHWSGGYLSLALRKLRRSASSVSSQWHHGVVSGAGSVSLCAVLAFMALLVVWYVRLAYVGTEAHQAGEVVDMQSVLNDTRFFRDGASQVSQTAQPIRQQHRVQRSTALLVSVNTQKAD